MSRSYYCLIAGLPEIHPDQSKKVFSLSEFKSELKSQLHQDDYELVKQLFMPYDNENLLNLIQKRAFNAELPANFSQQELEEEIREPGIMKNYMSDFIAEVQADDTMASNPMKMENSLTNAYYKAAVKSKNPFLAQWFDFDLTLRNIIATLNSKKYDMDVEGQLMGDSEINHAMARSSSKDLGISVEVPEIERIVQIFEMPGLLKREKSYDLFRWEWLDEHTTFSYFSIEVVLSYIIKLMIVERWMNLDIETGTEMFNRLINDIETSYQFPKEFNIHEGKR